MPRTRPLLWFAVLVLLLGGGDVPPPPAHRALPTTPAGVCAPQPSPELDDAASWDEDEDDDDDFGDDLAGDLPDPLGDDAAIGREDFTIDFGDFQARAQLTYPARGRGPFPTVLLVPGGGPAAAIETVHTSAGDLHVGYYSAIADHLTRAGYATVRYNKRYVQSPTDHPSNEEYDRRVTATDLVADADRVYAMTRANPRVDRTRVILYGASEGGIVATRLATMHPEVAGLVLHGTPASTLREVARYVDFDVFLPYLHAAVDCDRDGRLTSAEIVAAYYGDSGEVPRGLLAWLLEPEPIRPRSRIDEAFDRDGDGALDIETEIAPVLTRNLLLFDLRRWGRRELPTVVPHIRRYRGPVLILQGEQDDVVRPSDAAWIDATLAAAGHPDHTLRLYPGYGHSLGPADSPFFDYRLPMAPEPLADLVAWLEGRYHR